MIRTWKENLTIRTTSHPKRRSNHMDRHLLMVTITSFIHSYIMVSYLNKTVLYIDQKNGASDPKAKRWKIVTPNTTSKFFPSLFFFQIWEFFELFWIWSKWNFKWHQNRYWMIFSSSSLNLNPNHWPKKWWLQTRTTFISEVRKKRITKNKRTLRLVKVRSFTFLLTFYQQISKVSTS